MKAGKPIQLDFSLVFQLKYCVTMVAGSLLTSMALYLYLDRRLGENYVESLMTLKRLEESLPSSLAVSFGVQLVLVLLLTIAINLFVSHKIGGPVYRIERSLDDILSGDLRYDIRTRDGDQLKSMVVSLNGWLKSTRQVYASGQRLQDEVDRILHRTSLGQEVDLAAVRKLVEEVRQSMGAVASAAQEDAQ